MTTKHSSEILVDHLFRHEYGKMVASLSRFLGLQYIDVVEDIAQETFSQALQTWRTQTIPDNPSAWLMTTAKRKAIDYIRKKQSTKNREIKSIISGPASVYIEELFMDSEVSDNQLRMIFACCHPKLAVKDQIALTLKIASGFSSKEIAKGLLSKVETIKKRIQRARNFLKSNNLRLYIPAGEELKNRLVEVQFILYLLFNEGYYSSGNEEHIRRDLCYEAMRLCKLIVDHDITHHPDNHALMALMCFHASRFDSRLDDQGQIILLADQNRELWNKDLIDVGRHHLNVSGERKTISAYHLEAAISGEHARAKTFEQTNWNIILEYYRGIYTIKPSDQIILNQIIVLIQLNNLYQAENLFVEINSELSSILYHSVGAELYLKKNNFNLAHKHICLAEEASPTPSELTVIKRKKEEIISLM